MRKLIPLLLLVGCAHPSLKKEKEMVNPNLYEDKDVGFSLERPNKDWRFVSGKETADAIPVILVNDRLQAKIILQVAKVNLSPSDFVYRMYESLKEKPDVYVSSPEPLEGTKDGILLPFLIGRDTIGTVVVIPEPGELFVFLTTCPLVHANYAMNDLARVIFSFKKKTQ